MPRLRLQCYVVNIGSLLHKLVTLDNDERMLYDMRNDKRTQYDIWNLGMLLHVNLKHETDFVKAGGLTLLPTYFLYLSPSQCAKDGKTLPIRTLPSSYISNVISSTNPKPQSQNPIRSSLISTNPKPQSQNPIRSSLISICISKI